MSLLSGGDLRVWQRFADWWLGGCLALLLAGVVGYEMLVYAWRVTMRAGGVLETKVEAVSPGGEFAATVFWERGPAMLAEGHTVLHLRRTSERFAPVSYWPWKIGVPSGEIVGNVLVLAGHDAAYVLVTLEWMNDRLLVVSIRDYDRASLRTLGEFFEGSVITRQDGLWNGVRIFCRELAPG